jgi:hypothetical protein
MVDSSLKATFTKESSAKASFKARALITLLKLAKSILESFRKTTSTGWESWNGQMAPNIQVSSRKERWKAKAPKLGPMATDMMAYGATICSTALALSTARKTTKKPRKNGETESNGLGTDSAQSLKTKTHLECLRSGKQTRSPREKKIGLDDSE